MLHLVWRQKLQGNNLIDKPKYLNLRRSTLAIFIISVILLLDQAVKIWVKTNMYIGQETFLFGLDWCRLHFRENEGMAFGLTYGGYHGKTVLSLFRVCASVLMIYFLSYLIKQKASKKIIASLSLVIAGAIGNVIDCLFYGLLFSGSSHGIARFLPQGGGYADFLHGKVVDMFYLPIWGGHYPDWLPLLGGDQFLYFQSIFNIADFAITAGILMILFSHNELLSPDGVVAGAEDKELAAVEPRGD